jgi:LPS O-antigen subunit length determinant protein (WzzB/FepE family)
MKRWIALAAVLYPRSWRAEYGAEFSALLDDVRPRWRVFASVLGGAIRMQITNGTNWLKLAVAMAIAGAILAAGASFAVAPRYVSSAVISITPQPDPVRPVSSEVLRQRATFSAIQMENAILSRTSLFQTVRKLDLYMSERRRIPIEDVLEQMRGNIKIQALPSGDGGQAPIVFSISFAYPDQVKAQATVRELAAKFTRASEMSNRNRANLYRNFWHDQAAEAAFHHRKMAPAPPPPVGDALAVLDPASLPKSVGPNRIAFLAWGLGSGLLVGLLAALAIWGPRGVRRLVVFAVAGCALAGAASFLIPNRYTSTAVIMISPAQLTEDPLAAPRAATPAIEFLRQLEPKVFSVEQLSKIIEDPRLRLYPEERARKPIADVAREMLARDLRIAAVNPASGAALPSSAFNISFSYSDRSKAHDTVQTLIATFQVQNLTRERNYVLQKGDKILGEIIQRKAGEGLSVLDPPSLPITPVTPNRLLIAALGLGIGLLVGALTLFLPRPHTPTLQPA